MSTKHNFIDSKLYQIKKAKAGEIFYKSKKNNSAKVCILTKAGDLTDENIKLMQNILKAINISWVDDVKIRIFQNDDLIDISSIKNQDDPEYILGFGLSIDKFDVQFKIKNNEWIVFESFKLLLCLGLTDLRNNKNLKLELWKLLQVELYENR